MDEAIQLGVKLKPKDVQKTARDLRKDVASIFDNTDADKLNSKMDNILSTMSKLSKQSRDLSQKMRELASTQIPTDEYREIQAQIAGAEKELSRLNKQQELMEATGTKSGKAWDRLQYKIDEAKNTILYAKEELQDLVDTGQAFKLGSDTSEYQQMSNQLNDINNKLVIYKAKWQEAGGTIRQAGEEVTSSGERVKEEVRGEGEAAERSASKIASTMKQIPAMLGRGFVGVLSGIGTAIKKVASAALTAAKNVGKLAKNLLQAAGSAIKKGLSNVVSAIKNIGKHSKSSNVSVGKLLKKILAYGIGIRSLYALFNKLRSAIKEGLTNLAQFNDGSNDTNKAISELMSSLTYLKNSFGAAFAPILSVVAPILSKFIDLIAEATNKIGMFFAALSGKNVFTKAKKVQQDYAKSLDKTGKKLDDVNNKLGEYDKLSVIGQEDKNSNDSGTGIEDMFEDVPISSTIDDWVKKFKEAWENADFYDIGRIVGEKLRDALNDIPWEVIQDYAQRIAQSIGTFINGFIETEGLGESIGRTLGEAINTAFIFLNTLLETINWDSVGQFFADGLNSIVATVDWELVGTTIANMVNAWSETLKNFLDNTDFVALGQAIGTGLQSMQDQVNWEDLGHDFSAGINGIFDAMGGIVDTWNGGDLGRKIANGINTAIHDFKWAENAQNLSAFILNLFDALLELIENIEWYQLGKDVAEFIANIDWAGLSDRVFEGLGAILGGLAAFLWGLIEDAWNSVVAWWYDVAYEDGQFTMQGLLNGIWEVIKSIGTWIKTHIFDPIVNGFKKAFKIGSPSKVFLEFGKYLMQGLLNGVKSLIQTVVGAFNTLKANVVNVFTNLKNTVINIWNALWNGIKGVINSILGGIEKFVNGVIGGINGLIGLLNKVHLDVPPWMTTGIEALAGVHVESIGFNLPTLSKLNIPRLAQGAVIPPNKEFLAMLGDQQSGTNIETPLETMVQAFKQALSEEGGSNKAPIVLQLNGREVARVVWDETAKKYKQTGQYIPQMA